MAKYRKKSVIVDAEQFGGFYATPYPAGVEMEDHSNDPTPGVERYQFYVTTAHGQRAYLTKGDWVVADGRGYYPVKPDIFAATYEPADDKREERLLAEAHDALLAAMPTVPHPGGRLVKVVAHYESGSTQTIHGSVIEAAVAKATKGD